MMDVVDKDSSPFEGLNEIINFLEAKGYARGISIQKKDTFIDSLQTNIVFERPSIMIRDADNEKEKKHEEVKYKKII